jgi:hypothetical protein
MSEMQRSARQFCGIARFTPQYLYSKADGGMIKIKIF